MVFCAQSSSCTICFVPIDQRRLGEVLDSRKYFLTAQVYCSTVHPTPSISKSCLYILPCAKISCERSTISGVHTYPSWVLPCAIRFFLMCQTICRNLLNKVDWAYILNSYAVQYTWLCCAIQNGVFQNSQCAVQSGVWSGVCLIHWCLHLVWRTRVVSGVCLIHWCLHLVWRARVVAILQCHSWTCHV